MSVLSHAGHTIYAGVRRKLNLTTYEMQIAQVLCVAEEAGEFVGAFRRWKGLARRDGSFDDVKHELADVVIAAYTAATSLDIDLDEAINEKLAVVMTRGWKQETPA